jgi:CRISPR-associated Csx2 family protein
MARKIFLSILGTGYYETTRYYFDNYKTNYRTRFVQEATIKHFCSQWSEEDKIVIFLTEQARQTNWENPAQKKHNFKEVYEGLSSILSNFRLSVRDIPNGNSEKEIWEVFDIIFKELNEGDEVYFDITHAFRFLPMLLMVLINYAKLLKNISVKSVTYGNYEAREKHQDGQEYSPVMKITSLSELQDWTIATLMFKETGQTTYLNSLLSDNKENAITNFTNEISEVRSLNIIKGESAIKAKDIIDKTLINNPIFENLKNDLNAELSKYKNNDVKNTFHAVEFCIKHNLTQQGLTILQESIKTYILKEIGESDYTDEHKRNAVSGALSINKTALFHIQKKDKLSQEEIDTLNSIAKKVFELPYKKELTDKVYKSLSQGARNDINHAGYREKPKDVGYFKDRLEKYYKKTMEILNQ